MQLSDAFPMLCLFLSGLAVTFVHGRLQQHFGESKSRKKNVDDARATIHKKRRVGRWDMEGWAKRSIERATPFFQPVYHLVCSAISLVCWAVTSYLDLWRDDVAALKARIRLAPTTDDNKKQARKSKDGIISKRRSPSNRDNVITGIEDEKDDLFNKAGVADDEVEIAEVGGTAEEGQEDENEDEEGTKIKSRKAPPCDTNILRNVAVHGIHSDPKVAELVRVARELADGIFGCDLSDVSQKSNWKLTLLSSADNLTLYGFIVVKSIQNRLSIQKLAVPMQFRGLGFGRLLIEDLLAAAKSRGDISEIGLSSLPDAVTFYQHFGFKAHTGVKIKTDFEVQAGQVYMVKKIRSQRR